MRLQYMIVKAETTEDLEKAVNAWIKHGWSLQGGINFTLVGRPVQTMIKRR